jgi:hypothetical protein
MFFRPLFILIICAFFGSSISATETNLFYLAGEPTVRIGLATNARSVSITTSDTSLVAVSPDEPNKLLATNKIFVAPRIYRAPEIEFYKFEIQNLESQAVADALAADIRTAGEKAFALLGIQPNTWRVIIGDTKDTIEDANQYKADLADKGFEDVVIITEKKTSRLATSSLRAAFSMAMPACEASVRAILSSSFVNSAPPCFSVR